MSHRVIGLFDSGIGGLTVLQALHLAYPHLSFVYYGDSANAPWGHRSKDDLSTINHTIIDFLLDKQVESIITACNTSYSFFSNDFYSNYQIPFFGLTDHSCKYALRISDTRRIAILGTEGTIASRSYGRYLENLHDDVHLLEMACPDLVPFIEDHRFDCEIVSKAVQSYAEKMLSFGADTLIYACSHYPFLDHYFKLHCQDKIKRVNPADTLVKSLPQTLFSQPESTTSGVINFYISGDITRFTELVRTFPFSNYTISPHSF